MRVVEALEEFPGRVSVEEPPALFLAGGISECPDWQATAIAMLSDTEYVLLNPRRADYPQGDPNAADKQVAWEYRHLQRADAILFWFPAEGPCLTSLYELGFWANTDIPLFVGVHPLYRHRNNIVRQLTHRRPEVHVASTLEALMLQVKGAERPIREGYKLLEHFFGEVHDERKGNFYASLTDTKDQELCVTYDATTFDNLGLSGVCSFLFDVYTKPEAEPLAVYTPIPRRALLPEEWERIERETCEALDGDNGEDEY